MTLEEKFCSFELAKKLKTLNQHKRIAHFVFFFMPDGDLTTLDVGGDVRPIGSETIGEGLFPAFDCSELGNLLRKEVENYTVYEFPEGVINGCTEYGNYEAEKEADLKALMLIDALEAKQS